MAPNEVQALWRGILFLQRATNTLGGFHTSIVAFLFLSYLYMLGCEYNVGSYDGACTAVAAVAWTLEGVDDTAYE